MRKILLGLFVTIGALLLAYNPAQALYQTSGEVIEIAEDEVIDDDVFLSSKTVYIRGTINGDLYALGGNVEINGTVNGDVTAVGATIIVSGAVTEDMRLVGGNVSVSGTELGDDLNIVGGSLSIDGQSAIGGSLVAAGGSFVNQANVEKHLVAAAGSVSLNGNVAGDAEIGASSLSIGPGVAIGGNLRYPEESETQISDSASVSGTITAFPSRIKEVDRREVERAAAAGSLLFGINLGFKVWSFFAALLTGLLALYLIPNTSLAIAKELNVRPLASIIVGLLVFAVAGPIIFVLMMTIIGIPLALILAVKFLVDLYLAKLVVGMAIGQYLKNQFGWEKLGLAITFVTGLLVYYLLTLVPLVSFFISLLAIFAGIGAMYLWSWNWFKGQRPAA